MNEKVLKMLKELAAEVLELDAEREILNDKEDYKEAFEVGNTQRDIAIDICELILKG